MATVYTLAELSTMIDNLVSKQNGQATQLKEVVSNLQTQLVTLIKEVRSLSAGNGSPSPTELEAEILILRKKVESQGTQIKEVTSSVQSQIIKLTKESLPVVPSIDVEKEISDLKSIITSQGIKIKEVTTSVQSQIIKIAKETIPATISVGTVDTGSPGSPAVVTNVGTSSAVILDFTVPQGPVGPIGPGVDLETVTALAIAL